MASSVTIGDAAKAHADALVRGGRYDSFDEAVEAGLRRLEDDEEDVEDVEVDLDDLPPEHRAAVEAGLAAAEAGEVVDGEAALAEPQARYRAMTAHT